MNEPLLTINPSSGLILLALKGNILPFSNINEFENFLNKLSQEVESVKELISRPKTEPITEDYAHDVIESWERQLKVRDIKRTKNEPLKPKQVTQNRKKTPKNKYRSEKPMTQTNQPKEHEQTSRKSKSRVNKLKRYSISSVPDGWDPDELSWVLPQIAITDYEGGEDAKTHGHFVINVAEEIRSDADAKIPVQPGYGTEETRRTVEYIADLIHMVLRFENRKVVVHCAMGMERSVLCVVAYMQKYLGKTIDEAYQHIGSIRPIAADRRHWIGA